MEDLPWGKESDDTQACQEALQRMGYELPKYGADGFLGTELANAAQEYCQDHGLSEVQTGYDLPQEMADDIERTAFDERLVFESYEGVLADVRATARVSNVKGWRKWTDVTGIVLHQTGVFMSDEPRRFERLRAHMGILQNHETPVVLVADPRAYMHHANRLNASTFGIEINGHFPGTRAGFNSKRHDAVGPMAEQIESCKVGIRIVCELVLAHGGRIQTIHPHRVSSVNRRSDPGEVIWNEVGMWAQSELGLSDGGPGFVVGSGRPVPSVWDPRYDTPY